MRRSRQGRDRSPPSRHRPAAAARRRARLRREPRRDRRRHRRQGACSRVSQRSRRFAARRASRSTRDSRCISPRPPPTPAKPCSSCTVTAAPSACDCCSRAAVELGARLAEPGEFTKRAFLNGKLDLAQAESVADLIEAATSTAARAAARSLSGVFSRDVHALVEDGDDAAHVHRGDARLSGGGHRFPPRRRRGREARRDRRAARIDARAREDRCASVRRAHRRARRPSERRQVEPDEPARARGRGDRHAGRRARRATRSSARSRSAAFRCASSTPPGCATPTMRSSASASSAPGRPSSARTS